MTIMTTTTTATKSAAAAAAASAVSTTTPRPLNIIHPTFTPPRQFNGLIATKIILSALSVLDHVTIHTSASVVQRTFMPFVG
jgi:hypothetical protein